MKELERRLAEHSIELPVGGTLREDVIVKHGVRIGWEEALKWTKGVIKKNYLKEHIGVSEGTQYTNTGGLDSLSDIKQELEENDETKTE